VSVLSLLLLGWGGRALGLAQSAALEGGSQPVASLGEVKLNGAELFDALDGLTPVEKEAASRDSALLQQWVRTFLVQRMVLQEALAHRWENESQVKALLERTRESALVDSYLKAQGGAVQQGPTEAELRRAYEQKQAAFFVPRSYLLAQIFVAALHDNGSADEHALHKLANLQASLKRDADFASIARSQSEDVASSAQGGEIGWLTDSQIQPEIRSKLPEMKLHMVSDPILLADGWHIFRVQDIREAHTLTFEQVRPMLKAELQAEATQSRVHAYVAKLLQEHPPKIDETLLAKLQARLRP